MPTYLLSVRALLRLSVRSQHALVLCRKCQIPILTAPCNIGRPDLYCPFGCRSHHKSTESNRRSTEYYRTEEGRSKKRQINANRTLKAIPHVPSSVPRASSSRLVEHLRQILSRVYLRVWSLEETEIFLSYVLRQRSLDIRAGMNQYAHSSFLQPP